MLKYICYKKTSGFTFIGIIIVNSLALTYIFPLI